jgi:hypothetical protein
MFPQRCCHTVALCFGLCRIVQERNMTPWQYDSRRLVTVALIASGSVLAVTGLTMLASHWGAVGVWKAWRLIGVSDKAIGIAHQYGAVGFLGSAGFHISQKRRVVARHLGLDASVAGVGQRPSVAARAAGDATS